MLPRDYLMATVYRRSLGSWAIQFEDRDKLKRTLGLGRIPKKVAQTIRLRVGRLVAARLAGCVPDAE